MPRTARAKPMPDSSDWTGALTGFFEYLGETEKSPVTQANYRADLLRFTSWYQATVGERPVPQLIQSEELRQWRTQLREAEKLGPNTVNRKLSAIRSFLRWCESEGLCTEIRTPKRVALVQPPPRWLTEREKRQLLRTLERFRAGRDADMIRFLLNTGLRVDELASLLWSDITVKDRSGSVVVRKGKGRKQRAVPLNADARAAAARIRDRQGRRVSRDAPFLVGQRGAMKVRGIQSIVQKAGRLAGLDECSPHVLRHTFGKSLADAGKPIQVIADLMGHESLETTRRYVQPGQEDLAAAVESIAGGKED